LRWRLLLLAVLASGMTAGSAIPSNAAADTPTPDSLALTRMSVVIPAHARRLPALRIPVRLLPEGPDDGKSPNGTTGGLEIAAIAPTRLAGTTRREPSASRDIPVVGGTLDGPGSSVINPADAQIAVGPSDVVEMVNNTVQIWSKTGAVESTETLGQYLTSSTIDRRLDEMTDPRAVYDAQSGRWFTLALDATRDEVALAISPTAVPGAGAWVYSFPSGGCPDQPRLGVSDSLVAIGDDLFSDCGSYGHRIGGQVRILSKSDLMSGAVVDSAIYGPSPFFGAITPVVSLSSSSILWFAGSDFLAGTVVLFAADKVHAAALGIRRVPIGGLPLAPDALQSDPLLINTGDNRVQDAIWENNQLWLAVSVGCVVNGESGVHACARFVGINTTDTANPSLTMNAGLALDQNRDLFYPAVMPAGDGTLYAVFGYSSPTETPGIGTVTHPETPNIWSILKTGTGANESGRWGDYFGIARDPSDPSHIWVAAAYGTGGTGWATTVGALGESPFAIKPPPPPPPPIPDCVVPSLIGLRLAAATSRLYSHHCSRGRVSLRYSSRRAGVVLSQSESAGTHLSNGASVSLVESRGPRKK